MRSILPSSANRSLTLAVPTFRRAALLARLIEQVGHQTCRPDSLVLIDGEGGCPAVAAVARNAAAAGLHTTLVRSTQANLPFQRYLGRLAAERSGALVFLDDDLILEDRQALGALTEPLLRGSGRVAAVTAQIRSPGRAARPLAIARRFGRIRSTQPGSLTPGGVRTPPASNSAPYAEVGWLRGGAMAFRTSALTADCFPHALFALAGRGWGMGEDLALALRVLRKGRILLARQARFGHPGDDSSRAVRSEELIRGFASAYSRRLLNDLYRGDQPPRVSDRLALGATQVGALATALRDGRIQFAVGYAGGALAGLLRPPSPALQPEISWELEASVSLASMEVFPS